MTIEEKRLELLKLCNSHSPLCTDNGNCPLFIKMPNGCTAISDIDEEVEEAYQIAFGEESNNVVNHPNHYNREGSMECIDEMLTVFGRESVKTFCLLNVWKYRYRAADKNGIEDINKSDWYMNKYRELCSYETI